MSTSRTAFIDFEPGVLDTMLDQLATRLDEEGYPVLEAHPSDGVLIVDASSNPAEYFINESAVSAVQKLGFAAHVVQGVELN